MHLLTSLFRWDDAIRVAESARHPDAEGLRNRYYKYLLETSQEEKAGLVKEKEGDYMGAISLYLKGGLPARAAQVRPKWPRHVYCSSAALIGTVAWIV